MSEKPTEVIDSDSDSDLDFFTIKRAPVQVAPLAKTAAPVVPITIPSSPDYQEVYDSDESEATRKRKKRKTSKSAKPTSASTWLDMAALAGPGLGAKGRQSSKSTDRERSKSRLQTAEIEVPEEDELEKERRKRERIVAAITPPPRLTAEAMDELRAQVDEALPMQLVPDDEEEEEVSGPSRTQHVTSDDFEPDEKVTVNIHMVADPDRRAAGVSERALKAYEKNWVMFMNRRDPLSRMIGDLADKIHKTSNEIVVEYNGAKILHSLTPLRLGIQPDKEVKVVAFETAIYEKILKQREAKRLKQLAEENGEEFGEDEDDKEDEAPEVESEPEPEPEKKGTILRLRGAWGEATIRVADNISAQLLAGYYCKKVDHVGQESDISFAFDGEKVEMDTLVGDMGVEDRDIIDVICK